MKIVAITKSGSEYEISAERMTDIEGRKVYQAAKKGTEPKRMINELNHIENLVGRQIILEDGSRSSPVVIITITLS